MKKGYIVILSIILLFIVSSESEAQVYTGGNVGMHYDRGLYLDAAPLIGYRLGILEAGISPFYSFREYKGRSNKYSYGNRIFTQITFITNVFLHGEFEVSNVATSIIGEDGKRERKWITGLPVGAGYRYNLTDRTRAYGMILFLMRTALLKTPL